MMYFVNGLQWAGYKKFDWGIVGESACADSWGRALKTREPSLSIPCFAERRYGGVLDDEMLMALPPDYLPKAIAGMERSPRTGCATRSRNTASSRTCAPAWRSAIRAAEPERAPFRRRRRSCRGGRRRPSRRRPHRAVHRGQVDLQNGQHDQDADPHDLGGRGLYLHRDRIGRDACGRHHQTGGDDHPLRRRRRGLRVAVGGAERPFRRRIIDGPIAGDIGDALAKQSAFKYSDFIQTLRSFRFQVPATRRTAPLPMSGPSRSSF